ncbi:MAG: hypothetical protein ACREDE_03300 [Thermoplasmata archaeon]
MFSRTERDFLTMIVRSADEGDAAQGALVTAFPNPTYRRKLLWGIRRKATKAASDWELYARAARVELKVLPGTLTSATPPLRADPLVTALRGVRSLLTPTRRGRPHMPPEKDRPSHSGERK